MKLVGAACENVPPPPHESGPRHTLAIVLDSNFVNDGVQEFWTLNFVNDGVRNSYSGNKSSYTIFVNLQHGCCMWPQVPG